MIIGLLVIDLRLEGCQSLKEKRGRTRGIKDRFGKQPHVAVCESGYQDNLKQSQWSFIATATDKKIVDQILSGIENDIRLTIDAIPCEVHREYL